MQRPPKAVQLRRRARTAVVLLATCVIAAIALTACGSTGSSSTSASNESSESSLYPTGRAIPKGPVHLTIWWWGQQEMAGAKKWMAETVADYEKLHSNVKITTVLQTTEGLVPTFDTAAAAGKGPDIQYFWGGTFSLEPVWKGYLRPISDYLPESEVKDLKNAFEDTYEGKVWTMGWYQIAAMPVLYNKDIFQEAGLTPPQTWSELLHVCDVLNAKGITPITAGVKDGFFAEWLYSMLASQEGSLSDVIAQATGKQKFDSPKNAAWWSRLADLQQHKCFNSDIGSLALYQGQQAFKEGKAAMTMVAGAAVKEFVEATGESKVGVIPVPKWGNGPYAGKMGSTSQTFGITKTTRYPQVAASFLSFTHTQDRMNALYRITGAIPADSRFNSAQITMPQVKEVYEETQNPSPWLENFVPAEVAEKTIVPQVQLVLDGSTTPQKAAEATQQAAERLQHINPELIENFKKWETTYLLSKEG